MFDNEPILSTSAMVEWWRKWASEGKPPQKVECVSELMDDKCKRGTMLAWWGWDYSHNDVLPAPQLGLFQGSYWIDEGWDEDLEEDVFLPTLRVEWLDGSVFDIIGPNLNHDYWDGLLFIL